MGKTVYIWGRAERFENYRLWVEAAGGRPVFGRDSLGQGAAWDALLLPGGGDLEPWRYGRENTASRGLEPERDEAEFQLLQDFTAAGKPVLGVCRGLQSVNVFFGGTLIQDIPGHGVLEDGRDRLHRVRTAPSPLPGSPGERLTVNSAHHQAAGRLGKGLQIAARSEDGVPEGVDLPGYPLLGVQFHPERMAFARRRPDTVDGGALFFRFLDACRGDAAPFGAPSET